MDGRRRPNRLTPHIAAEIAAAKTSGRNDATKAYLEDVEHGLAQMETEIAAAREEGRRNERAEVVAYGNPTQFSTWGNQVARFIEAIERGEHTQEAGE